MPDNETTPLEAGPVLDRVEASARAGTYREWRVTGQHTDPLWRRLDPAGYDFVWSPARTPQLCTDDAGAEALARGFVASPGVRRSLTDIALSTRLVTVTAWTPVVVSPTAGQGAAGEAQR